MAGSIGNLSAQVTADIGDFQAKMRQATGELRGFAASAKSSFASVGSALVPGVGAGLAALGSAGGLASWIKTSMDEVRELGKESDKLGISMDRLAGYSKLAGGDMGSLTTGLGHLAVRMGEIQAGSEDAGNIFKRMGLDPQQIAQMNVDDAFQKIAGQMRKMNTVERAFVGKEIFGRDWQGTVSTILKGTDAMDAAAKSARESGLAPDRAGLEDIRAANKALKELDEAWSAIGRTVGVKVSPILKGFADLITGTGGKGHGLNEIMAGLTGVKLPGGGSAGNTSGKADARLEALTRQKDAVADFEAKLRRQKETWGQSAEAAGLYDLKLKGVKGDELAAAAAHVKEIEALRERDKLQKEGERIHEQNRTPLDKFKDTLAEVDKLQKANALSGPDAIAAKASAIEDLEKAIGRVDDRTSAGAGAVFGSQEAFSDMIHANDPDRTNAADRLATLMQEANEQQKQIAENTRNTAKALENLQLAGN